MKLSAAMIVKDAEKTLSECLESIVKAVDEIVIVDTGSKDQTLSIIYDRQSKYKHIRLFHFEWINDFAAARNYSLEQVKSEWAFVVDSDDILPVEQVGRVKELTSRMDELGKKAVFDIVYDNTVAGAVVESIPTGYVRLFPSYLRYEDRIHEQIRYGDLPRIQSDIHLLHSGYDVNLVDMQAKKKRNIDLLIQSLQADQENARLWMHLGREMSILDKEKALRYLDIAESKSNNPQLLKWISQSKKDL